MSTASSTSAGESTPDEQRLSFVEVCAGGGGLTLGLENAGFDPVLLLDKHPLPCHTLRENRPDWNVLELDLLDFDPVDHQQTYDVDLLAAGLPRVQAAATARRRRGSRLELDLLRATILLVHAIQPRALLIENVADLVTKDVYAPIREFVATELGHLGYSHRWFVINAADYGVPQDRKQGVLVAFAGKAPAPFAEPPRRLDPPITVGDALRETMAARGWADAARWAHQADRLAPTLIGGSWERGGADLGPTGSKVAWAKMGVDGGTIADQVPDATFHWDPRLGRRGMVPLTVEQAAILQGFPSEWRFEGRKTARYRQVGQASPPPVGHALGLAIRGALDAC
jgi:DNA (cytosine-5)-methyltransferase 1